MYKLSPICDIPTDSAPLYAGESYYVSAAHAAIMLADRRQIPNGSGGTISISAAFRLESVEPTAFDAKSHRNGRDIYLFRQGGIGDILMMTPLIRELVKMYPASAVHVCCEEDRAPLLIGSGASISSSTPSLSEVADAAIVDMNGVIEDNEKAKTIHGCDVHAERMGITLSSRRLSVGLSREMISSATLLFPATGKRRIGVQVASSTPVRSYHPRLLSAVITALVERGDEVFLFGVPGSAQCEIPGVTDLSRLNIGIDKSASVMMTCDAFLAPDSGLFHIAQAIGVPVVGLFGPFPSALRITNPERAFCVDGVGPCAPCHHHSVEGGTFPELAPCHLAGFCTVLAGIKPEYVLSRLDEALAYRRCNPHPLRHEPT